MTVVVLCERDQLKIEVLLDVVVKKGWKIMKKKRHIVSLTHHVLQKVKYRVFNTLMPYSKHLLWIFL